MFVADNISEILIIFKQKKAEEGFDIIELYKPDSIFSRDL